MQRLFSPRSYVLSIFLLPAVNHGWCWDVICFLLLYLSLLSFSPISNLATASTSGLLFGISRRWRKDVKTLPNYVRTKTRCEKGRPRFNSADSRVRQEPERKARMFVLMSSLAGYHSPNNLRCRIKGVWGDEKYVDTDASSKEISITLCTYERRGVSRKNYSKETKNIPVS